MTLIGLPGDHLGRDTRGPAAAPGRRDRRMARSHAIAAAMHGLDLLLLPGSAGADVLAQPRGRRVLVRDLRAALYLAALYQGDDHDGEDRGHRHGGRAGACLSPPPTAPNQWREGLPPAPGGLPYPSVGLRH